jgi:chorismate mutase/prephenate dehydratase
MARKASLPALRRDIDRIDGVILRLLNERARVVLRVAEQKARTNSTVYAAGREKNVLTRVARLNGGPLPDRLVRTIFREIISASRSLQGPLKAAYLGPEATFAHLAARQLFGAATEYLPASTIAEVFHEVESGRAGLGVVPVENSTEGMVAHTLDLLAESPLRICAEISLPIQHCLLARPGTRLAGVKRVAAHPQALAQCRQWLATHLPRVPTATESSNARAAERARGERGMAAIAAEAAAEVYGLDVLARGVQDDPGNLTRFLVLGQRDAPQPSGDDKTSLFFSARNQVGMLARMLKPFADHGVDLIKIESRPLRGQPWEYVFFIDCKGHRKTRRVQQALAEVGRRALRMKVLGSYPVAPPPNGRPARRGAGRKAGA